MFMGLLVVRSVLGGVGILFGGGWVWVIRSSSVFHTRWVVLIGVAGVVRVFTYYLGYMLVLASLVIVRGQATSGGSRVAEVIVVLASLPPLLGFGLKLYSLVTLIGEIGVVIRILAVVRCVRLIGYLRGVSSSRMTSVLRGEESPVSILPPTLSWGLGSVLMVAII